MGASEENAVKLRELCGVLRRQLSETVAATNQVSASMGESGAALTAQLDKISGAFDKALKDIDSVGQSFADKANQAAGVSDRAVNAMRQWQDKLGSSSNALASSVHQSSEKISGAAKALDEQTRALDQASARASAINNDLQRQAKESGADEFLRRMSFISEGLQSIAIDLNRVLEYRITDDDWRRYNGGDKGIFLRKIVGMRERSKLTAIKDRYQEDGEFREYVTRYLGQFNDLLARARRNDHEGVLAAALLTSDIGKVYMLLTRAIDANA